MPHPLPHFCSFLLSLARSPRCREQGSPGQSPPGGQPRPPHPACNSGAGAATTKAVSCASHRHPEGAHKCASAQPLRLLRFAVFAGLGLQLLPPGRSHRRPYMKHGCRPYWKMLMRLTLWQFGFPIFSPHRPDPWSNPSHILHCLARRLTAWPLTSSPPGSRVEIFGSGTGNGTLVAEGAPHRPGGIYIFVCVNGRLRRKETARRQV